MLQEIGPRMTMSLVKGEEGFFEGAVLFHKFVSKTEEEQERLKEEVKLATSMEKST